MFLNSISRSLRLRIALSMLIAIVGLTGLVNSGHSNALNNIRSLAAADFSSLPFDNVNLYASDGEVKGTVVFIPQIHRMPGSDTSDRSNDLGHSAQQEIYEYLTILTDNYGVAYYMTESGMYGELPAVFTNPVDEATKDKAEFEKKFAEFKNTSGKEYSHYLPQLEIAADDTAAHVDRNIYLRGANIKFEAERDDGVITYGSQDPETYAQTVEIVRTKLALRKQMSKIGQLGDFSELVQLPAAGLLDRLDKRTLLKKLLSQSRASDNNLTGAFRSLEREAQGRGDDQALRQINELQSLASDLEKFVDEPISAVKVSGSSKPLNLPEDPVKLKEMQEQNDKLFQEVVIDQRSREAADNFIKGMKETNSKTGVLVYGAGHGEQIVDRLNETGYSVVVISPDPVHERYPSL